MGLSLSVGLLAKAVGKVTKALAHPYEELLAMLPRQPVVLGSGPAPEAPVLLLSAAQTHLERSIEAVSLPAVCLHV